ncbi:hypothetical protein [Nocardia sp. BMG51109]|uniref:hypothetical protein n=1 Tax=Nocardia sp. BMG51109 TaxID=1056816 RepID=UPI0004B1D547|nr:hypothetical protein [Nocardia sp. BMG51109]
MTLPGPLPHRAFVHADGWLAEHVCQVYLLELTQERARELRHIHRHHHPDMCVVHLEAAAFLLLSEDDC